MEVGGVRRSVERSPAGASRNPLRRHPPVIRHLLRVAALWWVVPGASGCAVRPLTPGCSALAAEHPTAADQPSAQRSGGPNCQPPRAGHCDHRLRRGHGCSLLRKATTGPGTPGGALRPGASGVCAASGKAPCSRGSCYQSRLQRSRFAPASLSRTTTGDLATRAGFDHQAEPGADLAPTGSAPGHPHPASGTRTPVPQSKTTRG